MQIDSFTFGKITIDGVAYTSDVIVYPDRVDPSWWREKGHGLNIMDLKSNTIVGKVSACAACHKAAGVEVKVDKGSPLLCGIEIDWNPAKKVAKK